MEERGEPAAAGPAQPPDPGPPGAWERAGWVAAWGGTLALVLWMRNPAWLWLAAAGALALAWTGLALRRYRRSGLAAAAALALGAMIGGGVQLRLDEVARDWDRVRFGIEERAESALSGELDAVVDRGEAAVDSAIAAARLGDRGLLFARLSRIRERTGVSAVAVYDSTGAPMAWWGEHRGTVPDPVRRGTRAYFFSASPLFGYLYFTHTFDGGRTAVAAVLLEASVEAGEGTAPFAERFAAEHGIAPRFTTPERAQGESVWDWSTDVPILSVSFARLTQERWRERMVARGRWGVGAAWVAAVVLLGLGWYRTRRSPGVPVVVGTAGLFLAPLGEMTGASALFSAAGFVLPVPVDVTLGRLLVLVAGGGVWLLTRPPREAPHHPAALAVRTLLAALTLPLVLSLVLGSASEGLLAGHSAGGMPLVLALSLALALPLFLLLPRSPDSGERGLGARWWIPALLLAVALAVVVVWWWTPGQEVPAWVPALWAAPFSLFALAFARSSVARGALVPWLAAGWVGATAGTAHLWIAHMDARVTEAERELGRLGTAPDTYLDFLLREFSEDALRYAAEGRDGVGLLYQSWVAGGLAKEGYEARLALWDGTRPTAELRLTDEPLPDSVIVPLLAEARAAEEPMVRRYTRVPEVHYLLLVALPGGRVVSVAVPPRHHVGRSSALARLLDPGRDPEDAAGATALSLVPVADTAAVSALRTGTFAVLQWLRTPRGWRSETLVEFPQGPVHAHLLVRTPTPPLLAVRAVLVLALVSGVMLFLWVLARSLCGEPLGLAPREWGWLRTFRGRLTLALFAFFLLPMALFGAITYQALVREVVRTAAALARRSLEQAALEAQGQPIAELGEHVRVDLLLYENGVLTGASPPEVVELGLYDTWLPPRRFLDFATSEAAEHVEEQRIGGREYLLAYRRMGPTQVLAAPTPLASGEIARRQRELGNVIFLALLLGAGLSVVLSLLVGRALSRPIEHLSRAAAAVGAGNLRVSLAEGRGDEFGGLYRSFNRMVDRLRRARAAVLRETRRTEAVVAEAGTGVLALDTAGRVALINARAGQILGTTVEVGRPFPQDTPVSAAVGAAVREFRRSQAAERGEEMEVDGRVMRLRLRRLRSETGGGGVVVALEDITSEIRSARVLAWGEMARQVAHEIKNPLTPIKLSVQHLRRAHADRRPDFEQILERNVEAILAEIDRLGEIARAFARFGAPEQAAEDPVPVELRGVVGETLALYRGAGGGIDYRVEIDGATPRAYARVGELKEVLVNLLENARAALPEGGAIRFRTWLAGGGEWVMLDVADSGEGIPADLLPRVFEPQFSTRSSGTGLGLAIVRRLVESWGGEVTVDSEPGVGTTVHLKLRAEEGGPP